MNKRNLGRFEIKSEMIDNNPEEVSRIFSKLQIVPVRCEYLYHNNSLEYVAIGNQFDEVPRFCETPWYDLIVTKDDHGHIESIQAKKI